jgi:hypothetical protein
MADLSKDERLLVKDILNYYAKHHLSITSMLYVEVLGIVDKISEDIISK